MEEIKVINREESIFKYNNIEYTNDQQATLNLVASTINSHSGSKELIISGFAGTGKTTILYNMVKYALSTSKFKELFILAPTNKALVVLKSKIALNEKYFSTLHSVLYGAPDEDGNWVQSKTMYNSIVFIDESSMISMEVLNDIRKTFVNCLIIYLGDGYQLEPVGNDPKLLKYPSITLQQVMRNAGDILNYSIDIRNNRRIVAPTNYNSINIVSFGYALSSYIEELKKEEDSIFLVADNKKRVEVNKIVRRTLGYLQDVVNNEKLIAINNSLSLANGETFIIEDFKIKSNLLIEFKGFNDTFFNLYCVCLEVDGKCIILIPECNTPSFHSSQFSYIDYDVLEKLVGTDNIQFDESGRYHSLKKEVIICTYAYAISVHKSQGSQWEKVYVNIPSYKTKWEEGRWFYTAITRAVKNLVIIK
jgi:ATP-dependent exoDNAse (exonuclease V) alpha subunit